MELIDFTTTLHQRLSKSKPSEVSSSTEKHLERALNLPSFQHSTTDVVSQHSPDVASQHSTTDVVTQHSTTDAVSQLSTDAASHHSTTDDVSHHSTTDLVSQHPTTDVFSQPSTKVVVRQPSTTDLVSQHSTTDLVRQHSTEVITQQPESLSSQEGDLESLMEQQHFNTWKKRDFISTMTLYEAIHRYEDEFLFAAEGYIDKMKANRFMVSILETLYFEFPDFFFTYLPTGSLREGFGKILPSTSILGTDHDIMLVPDGVTVGMAGENNITDKSNVFTILESPDDHQAGFLWLKLEDEYLTHWHQFCMKRHIGTEGCSILSSFRWKKKIRQVLLRSMEAKRWVRHLESLFPWQSSSKNLIITVENNGPALTVDISAKCQGIFNCTRRSNKRKYFYADFTLGLHCKPWPKKAEGFLTSEFRENWPPKEAMDEIKRLGCHVVPKSSTNRLIKVIEGQSECTKFGRSPGLEWRYSFSQAEIILSKHIPQSAKSAYLAFTAVIKRQLNRQTEKQQSKVCSFALKCILYRVVERKPKTYWKTASCCLETIFMELMSNLQDHLEMKTCPNYWIPEINLLDRHTPESLASKQAILSDVMKDARHYVTKEWLDYCGCCRVGCIFAADGADGEAGESFFDSFSLS